MKKRCKSAWDWLKTPANLARLAACVLLSALLGGAMFALNRPAPEAVATASSKLIFVPARVVTVLSDDAAPTAQSEGRRVGTQELEIRLLSGAHQGEILPVTNYMSALFNIDTREGTHVIVRLISETDGSYYATLFNYDRALPLGALLLVFFAALTLLGGKKGVKALLGLLFTLICIWFLLIPSVRHGLPPVPVTVAVAALTAAVSLLFLNGFTKKTLCATIGCVGGVAVAGLAAAAVGALAPLGGFQMSEAEDLLLQGASFGLRISGLLICGVLISSLGAVMDVAMSISSALHEVHAADPSMKTGGLFRAGMNIGRDAMGTMANTLILAFAGSSFNMLLLIQIYDIPLLQLLNTDFLCVEMLQSVAGSLGIILTVPLVAAISARLFAAR